MAVAPKSECRLQQRGSLRTDIGLVREVNEDAAFVDTEQRLFIVADGMGGQNAGDVASKMAVEIVRAVVEDVRDLLESFAAGPTASLRERVRIELDRAVRSANTAVFERGKREPDKSGMGSTLDVVLVLAGEAFVAHVGDSRTYLVRDGAAEQLTVDHTVAQGMVDDGAMTEAEARCSPLRSYLSNAIGVSPTVRVEHVHAQLEPADRLLLCSDGLYDYFAKDELADWLLSLPAELALESIISEACDRGGRDNLTGLVVEIDADDGVPQPVVDEATTVANAVPTTRVRFESTKRHTAPVFNASRPG